MSVGMKMWMKSWILALLCFKVLMHLHFHVHHCNMKTHWSQLELTRSHNLWLWSTQTLSSLSFSSVCSSASSVLIQSEWFQSPSVTLRNLHFKAYFPFRKIHPRIYFFSVLAILQNRLSQTLLNSSNLRTTEPAAKMFKNQKCIGNTYSE